MSIYTHMVVGTNDLERARRFYDAALGALGLNRQGDYEKASVWGTATSHFIVTRPFNGLPASWANGSTIGFVAPNRAAVDEFHKRALANGGYDEGAPGPRTYIPNLYAAYVRDPDGNKIVASCIKPE